jgi:putative transposase
LKRARPPAGEQQGGEQRSAHPTARATDAGFKSQASAQRFLTAPAAVYNTFDTQRHLTGRRTVKALRAAAFQV